MSSGVLGDMTKLAKLRTDIGKAVKIAERIAPKVGPVFRDFVQKGFSTKRDPYGGAWKPISALTRKRGSSSALVRTEAMLRKIDYLPFGPRVKLILGTFYARFHISTGRRTLPKPGQMPDTWAAAVETETDKELTRIVGGSLR